MRAREKTLIATAFLTALVALTISATPASAHDELISSTPENGATLTAAPASVVLTFEEAPADGYTKVEVFDPTGASITRGQPTLDGAVITQPLRVSTLVGRYTVDWSVLSDDGHPVAGSFAFIVKSGAATSSSAAASTPEIKTGGGNGLVWLVVASAGLVVLACATAVTRRYRSGSAD